MEKEVINQIVSALGTLTLIGQIFLALLVVVFAPTFIVKKKNPFENIIKLISSNALALAFLVAIIATVGSLFLSEITHFTPCKLCWFQRIFMYPQVIILGIAAMKNDLSIKKYIMPLSLIGALIATYHYLLQMSPLPLPCTDEIANCALKQIAQYGYITIPLMAWTAFLLIFFLMLLSKRK